ncbi:MAG: hypothetical protein ACREBP_10080, partial [Sphingomicrobium sp.]
RQNRRARNRVPDEDDARPGVTVRTYEMQGGGRVTVYQRGTTLQVGDTVDFGNSRPRRAYTSRHDDDSPVVYRRGGEYFFR